MTLADRIRKHVLEKHLHPALQTGVHMVAICAGDIHREMGLSNRLPAVCGALKSNALARDSGYTRAGWSGPAQGTNANATFCLDSKLAVWSSSEGADSDGASDTPPPDDPTAGANDPLSEDGIKRSLERWLTGQGWTVRIAWGKARGVDVEARKGRERWLMEVKGRGSRQAMRVNYFISALGELLQRTDDPEARYTLVLPDLPQFRRLWAKLPHLAKNRTQIDALFVDEGGVVHGR